MTKYLYTFEVRKLNVLVATTNQTTYEAADVLHEGNTYERANIEHGGMSLNAEKSAGQLTLTVLRTHPIAQRFVSGYPDGSVRVLIHELEDDGTKRLAYAGKVRACEFEELKAKLTCTDALAQLQRPGPRLKFTPPCGWDLYGQDCGVSREAYAHSGTLTAISEDGQTLSTTLTQEAGYFEAGLAEINGQTRLVIESQADGTLRLFTPIDGLQVGDSITAYRGCNRTIADCRVKFSNHMNYGGFHHNVQKNIFYTGLN